MQYGFTSVLFLGRTRISAVLWIDLVTERSETFYNVLRLFLKSNFPQLHSIYSGNSFKGQGF